MEVALPGVANIAGVSKEPGFSAAGPNEIPPTQQPELSRPLEREYIDNRMVIREGQTHFDETIDDLEKRGELGPDTVIIFDYNETFAKIGEELSAAASGKPGALPERGLKALQKALDAGCKLACASNQPDAGHQVAAFISKLRGGYTFFPQGLQDMGVEVFGGDAMFFIDKFKEGDDSVFQVSSWVNAGEEMGGAGFKPDKGKLVMIGDRKKDMRFFGKVGDRITFTNRYDQCIGYKLPSLFPEEEDLEGLNPVKAAAFKLAGKVIP